MRKIEFLNTKETLNNVSLKTLTINDILIHSKYYPLIESEKFILSRNIENAKSIGVFGVGLGYHIYNILKKNENCIIYVFDVLSSYEKSRLYNDEFFKILINNNRIKFNIVSNYKTLVENLNINLEKCDEFIILKSYMQILKGENLELYNILMDFEAQRITNIKFKKQLDYNIINNKILNMKSMIEFYNANMNECENVFLIAAGPSLNDFTSCLKNISGKKNNFLLAVGTAVGTLKEQEIEPDAVCILDPAEEIYKQLQPIKNSQIPLLVAYSGSHKAAKEYNGPKYVYYNYKKDDNVVIECTNSVATAALSIAIKSKPKRIFFIGQDLGYVDNKVHSDNTVNGREHNYVKSNRDFITTDVFGKKIYTSKFYLDIKKWIERTIKINNDIKFINCSKGAYIEGCELCEAFELNNKYNVNG